MSIIKTRMWFLHSSLFSYHITSYCHMPINNMHSAVQKHTSHIYNDMTFAWWIKEILQSSDVMTLFFDWPLVSAVEFHSTSETDWRVPHRWKQCFIFIFPLQTYVTWAEHWLMCHTCLYVKLFCIVKTNLKKKTLFVLIYLVPVSSTPFICCPALQMRSGLTNARWCQRHARRANIAVENKTCGWD